MRGHDEAGATAGGRRVMARFWGNRGSKVPAWVAWAVGVSLVLLWAWLMFQLQLELLRHFL